MRTSGRLRLWLPGMQVPRGGLRRSQGFLQPVGGQGRSRGASAPRKGAQDYVLAGQGRQTQNSRAEPGEPGQQHTSSANTSRTRQETDLSWDGFPTRARIIETRGL